MAPYTRFFEVEAIQAVELAAECRNAWQLPVGAEIGPINTNFPKQMCRPIELVVICESPSFDELLHGVPAYGDTGHKIYNRWREARSVEPIAREQFHYWMLYRHGIYLTNLVRCQADWIERVRYLQNERIPTKQKDRRVKVAWAWNRPLLEAELGRIAESNKMASVIIACGRTFLSQARAAAAVAEDVGLNWIISHHPSRLAASLSWHYDPSQWGNRARTTPAERGEKNRS